MTESGQKPGEPLPQPTEVGPYRILSVLGRGGMGVVYQAEHKRTGERVAVKTVQETNPRTLMGIRTEVAASRGLRHAGVIRIVDEGLEDGLPWYAMELIAGRTVAAFNAELWPALHHEAWPAATTSTMDGNLAGWPSTPVGGATPTGAHKAVGDGPANNRPRAAAGKLREVANLYRLLCDPLGYIHGRGMVHRDLKPSNVFIRTDGAPVIMDFGLMSLARGAIGRESLSIGGKMGTVSYVAPEQIQGHVVDARADLYAIGCMLYESVTGAPPFGRERNAVVLEGHLSVPPTPPSRLVEHVPPELEDLILRLLAKRPQDRLGHADDLAAALAEFGDPTISDSGIRQRPAQLYRPQLRGRQHALDDLLGHLDRLQQHEGGLVLVGGESGIGKTFLVSEFGRRAAHRGMTVVTGDCLPSTGADSSAVETGGVPLLPFRPLLQLIADRCRGANEGTVVRLLGRRAHLLAAYEPALKRFASGDGELEALPTQAARDRLLGSLEETLAAISRDGPLVLILDDLQWADDLSLALLLFLKPEFFREHQILIVGTYRSEEVSPWLKHLLDGHTADLLALSRLDKPTVQHIVGEMLAIQEPPTGLVEFVARVSEGNPFFVAEYLRLLVGSNVLRRRRGEWVLPAESFDEATVEALPVPNSLQGILNRRVDQMSPATRALIQAGAVLGRQFEVDLLSEMIETDVAAVPDGLREATAHQVLEATDGGGFRFVHDKLLETCYAQIPNDRRQQLHAAAARVIEHRLAARPDLPSAFARLAHHYRQAGNKPKALEYIEKAAMEALAKSANREAAAWFKEALAIIEAEGFAVSALRRARWCRLAGEALHGVGELDGSADYYRRTVSILGWPAPKASLSSQLFAVLAQVLRQVLHRMSPRTFLERDRQHSDALLEAARAYDRLQQVLYFRGDAMLPMLHACISSLNLAERAEPSVELVAAYSNAHAVAGILPAHGLAEAYLTRAKETLAKRSDPNVDTYMAALASFRWAGLAQWAKVESELARSLAIAQQIGFLRRAEETVGLRGSARYMAGDFVGALEDASRQYHSALRGDDQTQCWGRLGRAQVFLVTDRLDEADTEIKHALELSARCGRPEQVWADALEARLGLDRDDIARSEQAATRGVKKMGERPMVPVYGVVAYAMLAEVRFRLWELGHGRPAADQAALKKDADLAYKCMMRDSARVYRVAGPARWYLDGRKAWRLGKIKKAERCWTRSLALASELAMPYDEGRAHAAMAEARLAGWQDHHRAARELFARLGAVRDLRLLSELPSS
jgi:serine/threonine protein kinase/tetratricopeptide (TPR) repeat protein